MSTEQPRSQRARIAAERALVRIVHHYGARPEFVLIGGLVPELLCAASMFGHAGTTDIDVQVDLEIATGAVNAARLEQALRNAEFEPDPDRLWRWRARGSSPPAVIKFELLADLPGTPSNATIMFDGSERLGAANLRGTGFASSDVEVRSLSAVHDGRPLHVEVNVTGLAGFLVAKTMAVYSRRQPKDWNDIAFVLLNNDRGGAEPAADAVLSRFSADLEAIQPAIADLGGNFADPSAQGPEAYASQITLDHPDVLPVTARADAVVAVTAFIERLADDDKH